MGGKLLEPVSASHTAPISVTGLTALAPEAGSMLAVPQDQQSKLTALTNVLEQLQQQGMISRVSSIDLTHVSCMVLRLDGSIDAKLPLTGDTAYYLRALNAAAAVRRWGPWISRKRNIPPSFLRLRAVDDIFQLFLLTC